MFANEINKHAFFEIFIIFFIIFYFIFLFIVKLIVHVPAARDGSVTFQQAQWMNRRVT